MLFSELYCFTDQKILVGAVGAHAHLAPSVRALKNEFLPILGVKNSENQKFFFPQISLFLGPIDGHLKNFLSALPFWLYNDS